ncbi:UPAR/Ly6 domain-containing protein crok [Anabrus simplex]|uniref:UPAR/Ly6 domain-containing protein crok n=1 Tax=Anabrus simplex TaxID=316456 RepID=UPI0035A2E877
MYLMAGMEPNKPCVVLIVLFILLVSVDLGLSIKCWKCRSDTDPKCADPFDNSTVPINDCAQEPELPHLKGVKATMCRKVRQKVDGQWRYIRGCAYIGEVGIEGDERFCLMRTGTYNIFIEYCTCNSKDGCNSASGLSVSYGIILVLWLAVWQWSDVFRVLR